MYEVYTAGTSELAFVKMISDWSVLSVFQFHIDSFDLASRRNRPIKHHLDLRSHRVCLWPKSLITPA